MTLIMTGEYHEIEEQGTAPEAAPTGRVRLYCIGGAFEAKDEDDNDYPLVSSLGKVGDIDTSGITDGQILVFDAGTSKWVPADKFGASMDDLSDVNATPVGEGQMLRWNDTAGAWEPGFPELDEISDVNAPTPADGEVLTWDNTAGEWQSKAGGGSGGDPNFVGEDTSPTVTADGVDSLAMGPDASAPTGADRSIVIGYGAEVSGAHSVGIGSAKVASALQSVRVGGDNAVGIGTKANADGNDAIAIGTYTVANNPSVIAIGRQAQANNNSAIAIGDASISDGWESIAIGVSANAGSGTYGVISIGRGAYVSGDRATAIGYSAYARGDKSIRIGRWGDSNANYSIALGDYAYSKAERSVAIGFDTNAISVGEFAFTSGGFGFGDHSATRASFVCRTETTDATAKLLSPIDDNANHIDVPSESVLNFTIDVVGYETATGDSFAERVHGAIKNVAGTTSIVGSVTQDWRIEDTGATAWDVAVTADDTNDMLQIEVTGEASHTIHWVARVELVSVGF